MLKRAITSGCVAAMLSVCAVGTAHAQQPDTKKAIYFTFSQPVTLPQVTLPAGKYMFRLADSLVNRSIVQIYSADGSKMHGMMMTIPATRPDRPNDPEIRFLESGADMPPAVATYWYPGDTRGWEFVYPREQAARIAAASKQAVLTTAQANVNADAMREADLVRVTPTGEQTALGSENRAVTYTGQPTRGELAEDTAVTTTTAASSTARTTSAAATTNTTNTTGRATTAQSASAQGAQADVPAAQTARNTQSRTALPATASSMPSVMLAGLLALFAAVGLRTWRRSLA
jgi:hypothetical protein